MDTNYSLVDENEDVFFIQHPNGTQAALPKRGMPKEQQNMIRSFPSAHPSDQKAPFNEVVPQDIPEFSYNVNTTPTMQATSADMEQPAPTSGASGTWGAPVAPEIQPAQPALPKQPVANVPRETPQQQILNNQTDIMGQLASSQSAAQKQMDRSLNVLNQGIQDTQKYYAKQRTDLDESQNRLTKEYTEGAIDPNQFWKTKTGFKGGLNRVLSMVGIILGGYAQNKTGVNPAIAALQKSIDQDIDSQKANLGKTKSLLDMNMQKYGDLRAAEAATKADLLTAFNAQLAKVASQTQSEQVKLNAQFHQEQINLERDKLNDEIAKKQTSLRVAQVLSSGADLPDETIMMLPKDLQEKAVKITNPLTGEKKWLLGKTPESVKEIEKINGSINNIVQLIDQMKVARAEVGKESLFGKKSTLPFSKSDAAEKYKLLHSSAIEELRSLGSGLRINEGTLKYMENQIPDPGSVFTDDKELDLAKNVLTQRLNNEIQGRVFNAPNLNPLQAGAQDVRP